MKPSLDEVFARLGIPRPADGSKFRLDRAGIGTAWIHDGRICCGENLKGISATDLYMAERGCSFSDALRDFGGAVSPSNIKFAKAGNVGEKTVKVEVPDPLPATSERIGKLAALRGIPSETLGRAVADGVLAFAKICRQEAFVIGDAASFCIEARRLDGEKFEAFGELSERKVHSKGKKKYPLVWGKLPTAKRILLCEGSADFLAAGSILGDGVDAILAILGKGINLSEETLKSVAGKEVVIFGHGDAKDRVDAWQGQLLGAGAAVAAFFDADGGDLNDMVADGRIGEFCDFLQLPIPESAGDAKMRDAERCEIPVPQSGVTTTLESSIAFFGALRRVGGFYRRGGSLCRIAEKKIEAIGAEKAIPMGESIGTFTSQGKNRDDEPITIPKARVSTATMRLILAGLEEGMLPEIRALRTVPTPFLSGGQIEIAAAGYCENLATFVISEDRIEDVKIPDAVRLLRGILKDFQFVTPSDESRALAMLFAPMLFSGKFLGRKKFPMFLIEADQSQTGKGYLSDLVPTIYGGSFADVCQRKGGVGSFDESLASALASGAGFIRFDNIRGRIDSQLLESIMTRAEDFVEVRVPHTGTATVPLESLFFATSNGAELTKDLANRICVIRLRKQPNDYIFGKVEGLELCDFAEKRRGKVLGALLALIRLWHEREMPLSDGSGFVGAFRHWGRAMDCILDPFGLPSGGDGLAVVRELRADASGAWLREVALRLRGRSELTAIQIIDAAEEEGLPAPFDTGACGLGRRLRPLFKEANPITIDDVIVFRKEVWSQAAGKPIFSYCFSGKGGG